MCAVVSHRDTCASGTGNGRGEVFNDRDAIDQGMVVEWGRKVAANSLGRDNGRKGDFLTGMLMVLSTVSEIGGAAKRPKTTLPRYYTLGRLSAVR